MAEEEEEVAAVAEAEVAAPDMQPEQTAATTATAMEGAATTATMETAASAAPTENGAVEKPAAEGEEKKPSEAPTAEARPKATAKAVKAKAKAPESGGITNGECCLIVVLVTAMLGAILAILYAVDAPLPWSLIGLGPPEWELSPSTWEAQTAGKEVFVKFYAPWCGHCKAMAKDWDKLHGDYANSTDILIAKVDCIGAGKKLCTEAGVRGFPTLKYGDPSDIKGMSDYKGGRSYKALSEFAAANLGSRCAPDKLDLCTEDEKVEIKRLLSLGPQKLQEMIDEKVAAIKAKEAEFTAVTEDLTAQYNKAQTDKDEAKAKLKEPLGLAKAVMREKNTPTKSPEAAEGTAEL